MHGLDLINTSVLGALGCDMAVFLRYLPAAETMYNVFVALAIGLILLLWVWNLFKNYGLGVGAEAEDPVKLTIRAILFIGLAYYADSIVDTVLTISGTPYDWILTSTLPNLDFASFNSVLLTIIGVCANGAVTLIVLILVLVLAWNYLKLLFEAAERYVLLGVLVYTAPVAFCHGCVPGHVQHLQKLVPDVRRPSIPAPDERMVPVPVHQHGGSIHRQPAITLRRLYEKIQETLEIYTVGGADTFGPVCTGLCP